MKSYDKLIAYYQPKFDGYVVIRVVFAFIFFMFWALELFASSRTLIPTQLMFSAGLVYMAVFTVSNYYHYQILQSRILKFKDEWIKRDGSSDDKETMAMTIVIYEKFVRYGRLTSVTTILYALLDLVFIGGIVTQRIPKMFDVSFTGKENFFGYLFVISMTLTILFTLLSNKYNGMLEFTKETGYKIDDKMKSGMSAEEIKNKLEEQA